MSKLVSALRTEGRYEYTSIYRESTHQCGVLATQKFFFYYNFSNHTSTKAEKKIDQFENVLVPLLPTMKGIAEKNSQVTLKKDFPKVSGKIISVSIKNPNKQSSKTAS